MHFTTSKSLVLNIFAPIFYIASFRLFVSSFLPRSLSFISSLFIPLSVLHNFLYSCFIILFFLCLFLFLSNHEAGMLNHIFCCSNREPVATTPDSCTKICCIILIAKQHLQSYYVTSGSNNPVMTTETVMSPAN
jgi:hypothetical protein